MVWVERLTRRHERHMREAFACSLERAVREVDEPLRRYTAAVTVDRAAVAAAAPLLLQVAELLREGPQAVEVMRLARRLVTDGAGPLYSSSPHRSEYPPGTLSRVAREILIAAEWQSPRRERAALIQG
ncbi:MAG: hypothetical protein JST59_30165 [Actinobacteria bacterium]|nr:hypothetical protein [Actinomycetota bacterium]